MVGIGLTDLPNIGGASGPPGPPSSGITEQVFLTVGKNNFGNKYYPVLGGEGGGRSPAQIVIGRCPRREYLKW